MKSINILIITIITVIISYIYQIYVIKPVDNQPSIQTIKQPNNLLENWLINEKLTNQSINLLYSNNYLECQNKFIELSKYANATLLQYNISDDLSSYIAIFKGSNDKFILSLSGTHGVEGYAGSAIQLGILQYMINNNLTKLYNNETNELPTIILYHLLNPYGLKNNRRVNEDNIDINRNFLTLNEFEYVKSRDPNFAGYIDINSIINPKSLLTNNLFINDIYSILLTIYGGLVHGQYKLKRALVSGNYYLAKGLGFGGFKQSKSVVNLLDLINELNLTNKRGIVIDIHTGLGKSGIDTLMFDKYSNQTIFTTEINNSEITGGIIEQFTQSNGSNIQSASSGYDLTIGTTSDLCKKWLNNSICLTQEFGTINMLLVGKSLTEENTAYHNSNDEMRYIYSNRLKDSFYLSNDDKWKNNVLRRGLVVFLQAFNYLKDK